MRRLAEYLESEPERLAAKAEAQKAKLEALERRLGIDNPSTGAGPSRTGSSSSEQPAKLAGKKHRFDDTEYLEQSRELVENVKSAVSAGKLPVPLIIIKANNVVALLKKKKKVKLSPDSKSPTDAQSSKTQAPSKMPTPVAVPLAPTEAVGA